MNLPHNSILVSLPYPFKFMTFKRKIGFSFVNLTNFLFAQENSLKTSTDYENLVKEKGEAYIVAESLYSAAKAYCLLNKKKENFTRDGLRKAIALSDTETQEQIMKVWRESETYGATIKKKELAKKKK